MSTTRFPSSWRSLVVALVVTAPVAAQLPPRTPGTVPITPPVESPVVNFAMVPMLEDKARVVSITNQGFTSPTLTVHVTIGALLTPMSNNTDGSLIEAFAYCEAQGTGLIPITLPPTPPAATPNKTAIFTLTIPAAVLAVPTGRRLHFGVRRIVPTLIPPSTFGYIEALDTENYKVFTF